MDFSDGIPAESRTLVVVPTMLIERREHRATWSKRSKCASSPTATRNLHFALLTDFRDAAEETLPEDEALLAARARAASRR